MKDFYYILGVDVNCSLDEIKDAYRKLSKKFHPDLNPGDAYFESRFREVKEAFDTLSDPVKRIQYDASLKKFRSAPGEHSERQSYGDTPKYRQYQARPAAFSRSKKRLSTGMAIIMVLIGIITAVYLVESFSSSRTHKSRPVAPAITVYYKTPRHHKKKHTSKNKSASDSSNQDTGNPATPPVKPATGANKQISPDIGSDNPSVKSTEKSAQPNNDKPVQSTNKSYLYETYVRPNVTGLINMRATNVFNSAVIKTIPANSKIYVLEKGDSYYRVLFDNTIGFVPKWALQVK
jgi:curved DNA-binding protein CbpA